MINYRGIPPRYREAVNHRRKARLRSLRTVEVVKSAAIPHEENFQLHLSPKFKQQLASSLCTNSTALHSLTGQTLTRERVWSNSHHHLISNTPRISWCVIWVSDEWRRAVAFLACCLERPKTCLCRTRPNLCSHLLY